MTIVTTYFANIKKLPDNIIPVSISLWPPRGWVGLSYPPLFPTKDILLDVKQTGDHDKYIQEYNKLLENLDKEQVISDLEKISGGKDVALCCYEKPTNNGFYCHRQLVAAWLGITEYNNNNNHYIETPLF